MTENGELARRLGLGDAVTVGLSAMIGAGLFAAFAPAAATGAGLLTALAVAGVVAWCNATSSAQLAVQHPASGGTYLWAGRQLGAWPAFCAGWAFVVGKTASCAAMALTFATYVVPASWGTVGTRTVAALAVVAVTALALRGIERTARAARVLLALVLAGLLLTLVAAAAGSGSSPTVPDLVVGDGPGWYATLQAAGLLFFAFAGYARIATLAEEVREPATTIPRAVLLALGAVLVLYAVTAVVLLAALGQAGVADARAPLAAAVQAGPWAALAPVTALAAALAALGALLALTTGVSRTTLAMARGGDLPRRLAAVAPGAAVPRHAELTVGAVVVVLVLTTDLRGVIGFSSFGVLLYYALANASALTQDAGHRLFPRALQVVGLVGCLVLVATLPPGSLVGGIVVLAVGVGYRAVLLARREMR